jgi:radical SAM superfamily enzyme YgiQ (UPF0313 family)
MAGMVKVLFKISQRNQQRQHEKDRWIWPVHLAMYATYLSKVAEITWDGKDNGFYDNVIEHEDQIVVPFRCLPPPDRILTDAWNPKYQDNGNFKYKPGTYIKAAHGCWHGKCTFCVERRSKYYARTVNSVMAEIATCQALGFKEIFDDSGTFPDGKWLIDFCLKKIDLGLKIPISCNMRIGANVGFKLMKRAGFRMLLFGIESGNQKTLDRLQKGVKVEQIIKDLKRAAKAGLAPHIAVMFGYAWESKEEEFETLKLVHYLLRKGYAKTAQASRSTIPGVDTLTDEDRPKPRDIYRIGYHPEFWLNKLKDLRSWADVKYLWRGIREGMRWKESA